MTEIQQQGTGYVCMETNMENLTYQRIECKLPDIHYVPGSTYHILTKNKIHLIETNPSPIIILEEVITGMHLSKHGYDSHKRN